MPEEVEKTAYINTETQEVVEMTDKIAERFFENRDPSKWEKK